MLTAAALMVLLVACGTGDDDAARPGPNTEEATPTAPEDQEAEAAEEPATVLTSEQVEAALLPAEDLGSQFMEVASDDTEAGDPAEDLGCFAGFDDPSGEPVASASQDYEAPMVFASMLVDSFETVDEIAASFEVGKEALATCGTETIDGMEVEVTYDPEFTAELVEGVDDQIFVDMYGLEPTIQADVFLSMALIRIENNAVILMFAEMGFDEPFDREGAVQQAADRLRAVMEGEDLTASADPPSGPGTYEFEYMGAVGTIEVPTDPSHPALAEFEEYRQDVGAEPVTYFAAEVDNTDGTEDINMYQVIVITEEGEQIEAEGVDWIIDDWRDLVDTETNEQIDLRNRGVDLMNDQLGSLLPGAKDTLVLATSEPVDTVSRVFVYPAGGVDRIEATKSDDAGS